MNTPSESHLGKVVHKNIFNKLSILLCRVTFKSIELGRDHKK